jgi:hypothetical protein
MIQAIVLSNDTLTRTRIIGLRTGDVTLGIIKAMMIENLKEKMRNNVAHFIFIKKDGSVREAWGTTNKSLVAKYVKGWGESRENYATTAYYDVEKGGWRSLRWESIVKVF